MNSDDIKKKQKREKMKVIVGLGKTGISCARFFAREHIAFSVQDSNPTAERILELQQIAPAVTVSVLDGAALCLADEIILSPGVPLSTPAIAQARLAGVPVTGDVSIFLEQVKQPVIAITGSNGKSTVTALVGEILAAAGMRVGVGGNIGTPCLDLDQECDIFVLELSSYQLEVIEAGGFHIAVVLNLSPDHLDRYPSVEDYYQTKQRIYQGAVTALLNRQSGAPDGIDASSQLLSFGNDAPTGAADYGMIEIGGRLSLMQGTHVIVAVDELNIKGRHNALNALVAIAIADQLGVTRRSSLSTLRDFTGLPHRCEWVGCFRDVEFINDSKATNTGATAAAIEGLAEDGRDLVLILGGVSKGADFTLLRDVVARHVSQVYLFGQDADLIATAIDGLVPCEQLASLSAVISTLAQNLPDHGRVIFAPACASFDEFRDFEHRGDEFKRLVREAFL
ncbi:MAG: UDP-N-acetylmuramoylalanine--D-glutamate ligase [Candidatus Azotimanducaceae bacterium]|jgi:UDP-N-acetylmuramoylalanine--D-glutamate ligase